MTTFVMMELQNINSRRAGKEIEANDLNAAKRAASRMQMFKGTALKIETLGGVTLAVKQDGKWTTL